MLACGMAGAIAIAGPVGVRVTAVRRWEALDRERDIAAAMRIGWRSWVALRVAVVAVALLLGILSGVWLVAILLGALALVGVRFAVGGNAARRRLRMERAFLGQVRVL